MKRIALINCSPKVKESASGEALKTLKQFFEGSNINEYSLNQPELGINKELLADNDVFVFALPLYVDGIPSHLLHCLREFEKQNHGEEPVKKAYAIVNCGFYEGKQNINAISMMENWCGKANLIWGGAIGIGGGGMLSMVSKSPEGRGPMHSTWCALKKLAMSIAEDKSIENIYSTPNFPRRLYILAAHMGWRQQAKKNGLTIGDIERKRL